MESLGREISRSLPLFGEMMKIILKTFFFISFVFSSDQISAPEQDHPIMIKGATIHTISHGKQENADIIFEKGKILSVGGELDGMTITKMENNSIMLEKDGIKYRVNYN